MPEFLLEVGCEEIPAGWLPAITDELRERFVELASAEHLEPRQVEAHSTPRRLVVRADVLARQPDRVERIWGPVQSIGMDDAGNLKAPALGFAKKQGVPPEDLQLATKPGQELPLPQTLYFYVDKKFSGQSTVEVLSPLTKALLHGVAFPKRMSWDAWLDDYGAFMFGRPVRWIVALLDGKIVPFEIFERRWESGFRKGQPIVKSGAYTRGHRFFPRDGRNGAAIAVRSFSDLIQRLREHFVLVSRDERAAKIEEELSSGLAERRQESKGARYLTNQWANLVEHPSVVFGKIPEEFHELPLDVVATVLVHHQKYIPVGPPSAGVTGFAAVTDTDGQSSTAIARGMERVVVARLRDAAFFFAEDLKRPLADRVTDLEGVTFHAKLGTYKEKTERLVELVYIMGAQMTLLSRAETEAAQTAAQVCKTDLTTLLVREFPELQGVMGGIYLRAQRASPVVVSAVQWHYHPLSIEADAAPAGQFQDEEAARVFAALSLADKIDTLVGYFGIGEGPTGSRDPYALRRAAQGVIRVLIDFWRGDAAHARPNLGKLINRAHSAYKGRLEKDAFDVGGVLLYFLHERLVHFLRARGFSADEISAAVDPNPYGPGLSATKEEIENAHPLTDPYACYLRVRALHRVRAQSPADFEHLAIAFKRARNILEKTGPPQPVDVILLTEPAERELFAAVEGLKQSGTDENGDLEGRLRQLAKLRTPVDRFFDDVLVMAEDPKVRANRLSLLSSALSLFYKIADISKLGG